MKRLLAATLVLVFVGMATLARADDTPNPTGTWKWTMNFGKQQQSREVTLKLKLDGETLSGAIVGRDGKENPIQNATYKDGDHRLQARPRTERRDHDHDLYGAAQRRHDQREDRVRAQRQEPQPRLGGQTGEGLARPPSNSR